MSSTPTQLGIASLLATITFLAACSQEASQPTAQAAPPVENQQLLGPKPGDVDEGPTPAERRAAWLTKGVESTETEAEATAVNTATSASGSEGTSRLK